nr:glycine zipper 2TM domain-containing protein [Sphingomonas sp. Mn802worker]
MIRNALFSLAAIASMTAPMAIAPAAAQRGDRDYNWRDGDRNWNPRDSYRERRGDDRRLGRNDRIYRGQDGRAYCKRNDGTTGLVVGGVGGALLGNLVGGGTLGTLAGGGAGALLGRSIDRGNVKCR